jgi:hypothetical protein
MLNLGEHAEFKVALKMEKKKGCCCRCHPFFVTQGFLLLPFALMILPLGERSRQQD